MTEIIEKKFTVGPGIKHAIIWISFIVTYLIGVSTGWYAASEHYRGDIAVKEVEVMRDDGLAVNNIKEKEERLLNNLEINREQRKYNSNCADATIHDIINGNIICMQQRKSDN